MASTAASSAPETPITLKVNYLGTTRRFKLTLRDMVASTLEDKVRSLLAIPAHADCLIERYSDSAAAYVVLDRNNNSVWKQLYRAAKAKQKLKLRVNYTEPASPMIPMPVTVEDVPETSAARPDPMARMLEPIFSPAPVEPKDEETDPVAKLTTGIERLNTNPHISPEEAHVRYLDSRVHLSNLINEFTAAQSNFNDRVQALAAKATAKEEDKETASTESQPASDAASTKSTEKRSTSPLSTLCPSVTATFAVCCNSCDKTIPGSHYHCSTCDDGDFDLCHDCVEQGITCYGTDHWLIKRVIENGQIINSTTETIAPKPKVNEETKPTIDLTGPADYPYPPQLNVNVRGPLFQNWDKLERQPVFMRTCNSCVEELVEQQFLHCTTCEDFDLCKSCFGKDQHGHHPKHGFAPAVPGTLMPEHIMAKLSPGRNQVHNAICDGCDKFITGVRHKCLDCPDWDYCANCVVNANFVHPNHRFVPVYEPLTEAGIRSASRPVHFGICCDGPLCATTRGGCPPYITGVRYKCAVCHDTDFCANCEASPANRHNKTHPLIKFKTPVRHVSVTTTGEREDGKKMPSMGDNFTSRNTSSRGILTNAATISETNVQTVVDVKPTEAPAPAPAVEEKQAEPEPEPEAKVEEDEEIKKEVEEEAPVLEMIAPKPAELSAIYLRDTIADGTVLAPNHVFEQTWVLRNAGSVEWPAGCSVKFVGGDYMGHVDSAQPAGISELVSASESTVCYQPLAPGQEFPFTVLLRTPAREGKIISYWRLTTKDGFKFGHRLWCDVVVQAPKVEAPTPVIPVVEEPKKVEEEIKEETQSAASSQMVFPKLETESSSSTTEVHKEARATEEADDFEDCEDDEWDASDDGFLTDEEYDILDASDEEFLGQQQKPLKK